MSEQEIRIRYDGILDAEKGTVALTIAMPDFSAIHEASLAPKEEVVLELSQGGGTLKKLRLCADK